MNSDPFSKDRFNAFADIIVKRPGNRLSKRDRQIYVEISRRIWSFASERERSDVRTVNVERLVGRYVDYCCNERISITPWKIFKCRQLLSRLIEIFVSMTNQSRKTREAKVSPIRKQSA